MDTATHTVMGIGLGGLATIDPAISAEGGAMGTILIATIIGSQAPDFDTVLKLKNNAVYIRYHRGPTHSIPAVLIWPVLLAALIYMFSPDVAFSNLWFWSFIAVALHVFVDIFNAYGTQALSPFTRRWIALGVINIFDSVLFFSHLFVFILWWFDVPRAPSMIVLYVFLLFYYLWRFQARNIVLQRARRLHPDATHLFISPTYNWYRWHLVIRTPHKLFVTNYRNGRLRYFETYPFEPIPDDPVINAARYDRNLASFLSFSPTYRWIVRNTDEGYEVKFIDLRYRSKGYYPFVAVVQLNEELEIMTSYTGWIFSDDTLHKKLDKGRAFSYYTQ